MDLHSTRLLATSHRLQSARQAAPSEGTKDKSKAYGNSSIPSQSRLYLRCSFDYRQYTMFVNATSTLEDGMSAILENLPTTKQFDDSVRLVVTTMEEKDWRYFDRRLPMNTLFNEWEVIELKTVAWTDCVNNQGRIESILQLHPSSSLSSSAGVGSMVVEYEKGDRAMYMLEEPCTILDKHMDDYPNLYYTVRLERDGRDKQTIPSKLSHRVRPLLDGNGMHFRIEWSNSLFNVSNVDPEMTINGLREYIENSAMLVGFRPALCLGSNDRLICRGKPLPSDGSTTIKDLQLKNGAMISIQS